MDIRRAAFVLASVMGHAMIVNRFDYAEKTEGREIGVGFGLLEHGSHEADIAGMVCGLADHRLERAGPGVTIIDGGANIGTHTVTWARHMGAGSSNPWGKVLAFEPQEWPYNALCGNLALNNCFNAGAVRAGLGSKPGQIGVPITDPQRPVNYGGVALTESGKANTVPVPLVTIDQMGLNRLDVLKLDVEGMEPDALIGAKNTIARCKPIIVVEWIVCGKDAITPRLPDYEITSLGMDLLAIHKADPALAQLKFIGSLETVQ